MGTTWFAALFVLLSVVAVPPAMSANLIATPRIAIDETWDSNVFSVADNTSSDFITRAIPSLALSLETYQTTLVLLGSLEFSRYADHDELNGRRTTSVRLSTGDPFKFSPRLSLQPTIYFVESQDSFRRNQLIASPVPGLPPSEIIITEPTKTRDFAGSLALTYLVSPLVDLGIGAGGTKRTFLDNNVGGVDSDTITGNASVLYRISPRTSTGITVNAAYNTFEDDTDSRSYGAMLSVKYLLSERYTFDAAAGVDYLRENARAGQDTSTSPSAQVSLDYRLRDFRAALIGSYGLAGGGSFGVTTHRGNIQLKLTDQFLQGWWWDLGGLYQINQSLDTPRTEDIYVWAGNAGVRYQPVRWASLRLAGDMVRQRSRNGIESSNIDRNTVTLGVDLSYDYKIF